MLIDFTSFFYLSSTACHPPNPSEWIIILGLLAGIITGGVFFITTAMTVFSIASTIVAMLIAGASIATIIAAISTDVMTTGVSVEILTAIIGSIKNLLGC